MKSKTEKPLYTTPALRYFPNGLAPDRDTGVWFCVGRWGNTGLGDLFAFPPNPTAHTYWLEAYTHARHDTVAVRVEKRDHPWWDWRPLRTRFWGMLFFRPWCVLSGLFPEGGTHTLHLRLQYLEDE